MHGTKKPHPNTAIPQKKGPTKAQKHLKEQQDHFDRYMKSVEDVGVGKKFTKPGSCKKIH